MRPRLDAEPGTAGRSGSGHGLKLHLGSRSTCRRDLTIQQTSEMHMHNQPQQQDSELYVKQLFRCIDGEDWSGLSDFLHEDAIYERPGYQPFVGKPAIMQF